MHDPSSAVSADTVPASSAAQFGRRQVGRRLAGRRRVGLNVVVSAALVAVGVLTGPGRLVGLAVAAAIGISCEVLAPLHGGSRPLRAYATDLTHAIGNRCLILPLVAVALSVGGPFVAATIPSAVGDGFAGLPGLTQIVALLLVTDLVNYLAHRALHRVELLWSFHAVHHSSERLDWLATSRGHPVDLAFNIFAISLPTYALGRVDLAPWLLTFFFLYPFVCHANARVRVPGWVGKVFVTPEFHHWHHAAESRGYGQNFGAFLTVWDRMLGTAIEPGEFPERYGIRGRDLDAFDYVGQLAAPFRRSRPSR